MSLLALPDSAAPDVRGRARRTTLRVLAATMVALAAVAWLPAQQAVADDHNPADLAPPTTIRVCRSNGTVEEWPFRDYVKIVLPGEFPSNWPIEALRAGAVAIKSYAWYYVRHPISDRCDIGDTTRHQYFNPDRDRRTTRTNAAVEQTWRWRLEDASRNDIAFAQYCSQGCLRHNAGPGPGTFIDQDELRAMAADGWGHVDLLHHFYRNLPPRLFDWTEGIEVLPRERVLEMDSEAVPWDVPVSGMPTGDGRATVEAHVICTVDGSRRARLAQTVVPREVDGTTIARFTDLGRLGECEDDEGVVVVRAVVNAYVAAQAFVPTWRRWTPENELDVQRLADTDDPVAGAVAISRATFGEDLEQATASEGMLGAVPAAAGDEEPPKATATFAVIARGDAFADALGATALAGTSAPILLVPGGEEERLPAVVRDELDRVLPAGAEVVIVGGRGAVSQGIEDDLAAAGYDVTRIRGDDRVATALAVADRVTAGEAVGRVLLVRATPDDSAGWADAVTAGPWAARTGTPVLLTPSDDFPQAVEDWIEDPANGVDEVVVVGGRGAVTAAVESRLDSVEVSRIAGVDRGETAVAVATQLWGSRGTPAPAEALVVDTFGDAGWPFAVAGSVWAATHDAAAAAVSSMVPPTSTGAWLDGSGIEQVTLFGGTGIISSTTEAQLRD